MNKATIENNGIIQSKGNILLNSTGDLNLNKAHIKNEGDGRISLEAKDSIQIKNKSKIEAKGGNINLSANDIHIEDKSRITSDQNTNIQAKSDIKVDNVEYIEGVLSLNFNSDNKTSITRSTLASGQEGKISITDAGLGRLLPLSGSVKPNTSVQIKDENNKVIAETTSNAEGYFAVEVRSQDQKVIIHAENNSGQPSQETVQIKVDGNNTLIANNDIKKGSKSLEISTKNALNFDSNKTDNLDLKLNTAKDLHFKQEATSSNTYKNIQISSIGNTEIIGNRLNANGSIFISAGGRLNLDTHLKAADKVNLEAKKGQLNIFSGRSIFAGSDIYAAALENDLNGHHIQLNSEKGKISLFANGYLNLFSNLEHRPAKHDAVKIQSDKDIILATIGHGDINLNGVNLISHSGQIRVKSKQKATISSGHFYAKNDIEINAGKNITIDNTGLDSRGKEGIKLSAENRTKVINSQLFAHNSGIKIIDLNKEGIVKNNSTEKTINNTVRDNFTIFENNRVRGKTQFLDISTNANLRYINADILESPNLNLKMRSIGDIFWLHKNKANNAYGLVDIYAKGNLGVSGEHLHANDSITLAGNELNVDINIRSNKNIRLQSDHKFLNIFSGRLLSAGQDIHATSLNSNLNGHHIKLFADQGSISLIAKGYVNLFSNLEHKHVKVDHVKVHAEKDVVIASTGNADVNINATSVISRQGKIKIQSNEGKLHLSSLYTNSKNNLEILSNGNIILDGVDLNSKHHIDINSKKNLFINTLVGNNNAPLFHSNLHSKLHAIGILSLKGSHHIYAQNTRLLGGALFINTDGSFNTPRNIAMHAYGSDLLKNNPILRSINGKLSVHTGWGIYLSPHVYDIHALGDIEFISKHGDVILPGYEGHHGLGSGRTVRLHSREGSISLAGKDIRLEGTQLHANKGIKLISTHGDITINGVKHYIPTMVSKRRLDELHHQVAVLNKELKDQIIRESHNPKYQEFRNKDLAYLAKLADFEKQLYRASRIKDRGKRISTRRAIERRIDAHHRARAKMGREYAYIFVGSTRIRGKIAETHQDTHYFNAPVGGYEHAAAKLVTDHGNIDMVSSRGTSISGAELIAHAGAVNIEARAPLNQVYKSTARGRDGRPIFRKGSIIIDGTQDFYDKGHESSNVYSFRTFVNPTIIHGTRGVHIQAVSGATPDDNLILQATAIRAPHGDIRIEAVKNILFDAAIEQSFSREHKRHTKRSWGGMRKKAYTRNTIHNDIDATSVDLQARNIFVESKERNPYNSIDIYSGKFTAHGGRVSIRSGGNLNFYTVQESMEYKNDVTRHSSFLGMKYKKSKTSETRSVATELPTALRADYIGARSGFDMRLVGTEFHYLQGAHLESGGVLAMFPARTHITELLKKESSSTVWQSQQDQGSIIETAQLPSFTGPVLPTFKAAGGLQVQVPISEKDKNKVELRDEILKLSEQPGQEYLKELVNRKDVDWNRVLLTHKEWDYKSQGLTGAGAALIVIIVTVLTAGTGTAGAVAAATGSQALGAMALAATTSLATQASISLINNGGDIGKTLKDLGSKQALRGLATAVVTAGIMSQVGAVLNLKPDSAVFSDRLLNNFTNSVGSTLIHTGINGGNLEENLKQALLSGLAGALQGELAIKIKGLQNVNYVAHKIAHAVAGCAVGAIQKQCAAGAVGAAVGEIVAEDMLNGRNVSELSQKEYNKIVNTSQLIAGSIAALAGYDVNVAANSAVTAVQNNALSDMATTGKLPAQQAEELVKQQNEAYRKNNCAGLSASACTNQMYKERQEFLKNVADYVPVISIIKGYAEAKTLGDYLIASLDLIGPVGKIVSKSANAYMAAKAVKDIAKMKAAMKEMVQENIAASRAGNTASNFKNIIPSENAFKMTFSNNKLLLEHFRKHGTEFTKYGVTNVDDYLHFGQKIIRDGKKVKYLYNGEKRIGYVDFLENNSRGIAKFVIVGTNSKGDITTIHTQTGKDFWRTINGNPNDKVIREER